jgi:predicted nucleic acid-binding protein
VYLSPINVAELQFGVDMPREGSLKQRAAAALRRMRKPQLRIAVETGEVFGSIAATLRRSGRDTAHRVNDVWLAAQAIERDFMLLTSNPRDFEDIPRLKMVALRLP